MYSEDAEQQRCACYIYHTSSEHVTNQSPMTCNKHRKRHFRLLTKNTNHLKSSSLLILQHSNHISSVNQASCKNDTVKVCFTVATVGKSNPPECKSLKKMEFHFTHHNCKFSSMFHMPFIPCCSCQHQGPQLS